MLYFRADLMRFHSDCIHADCFLYLLFLFFQAEDGIRDGHVTGVQTCALPISRKEGDTTYLMTGKYLEVNAPHRMKYTIGKIGRASCRERVSLSVDVV